MTLREYYRLTIETTKSCFKICGVIFTSIYALIAIVSGYKNESFSDTIEIFIICFLLGNGFGLFIWLFAFFSSFGQFKSMTRFYESIPNETKEEFGLILISKPQNPKYNFLQLEILDTKSEHPFLFKYDKKFVWIVLINDLSVINNFQKRIFEIQKKYKMQQIVLTGWGLRKNIKWKDWKTITNEKVNLVLEELKKW